MEKFQEDTLNMYQAANDVLVANLAIYAANVPFKEAVTMLGEQIEIIQNLRDQQDEDIKGITEDKQQRRELLEEQTHTIGSIITFYASTTNNRTLLQKVNFTRSALRNSRDNELPGMSEQVHQEAVANAAALLPFGLTAPMTTALETAISDFVAYISKPRAAKSETSAATEQLPTVFEATTTLLEEQLDRGMELFKTSHVDFYQQYFNARIVVNSPTRKRALEITFKDSVTQQPIAHINVKIDDAINRRSSNLGNIRVQNLTEGSHTLIASLPGYNTWQQTFNVITGETTKLVVLMVAV